MSWLADSPRSREWLQNERLMEFVVCLILISGTLYLGYRALRYSPESQISQIAADTSVRLVSEEPVPSEGTIVEPECLGGGIYHFKWGPYARADEPKSRWVLSLMKFQRDHPELRITVVFPAKEEIVQYDANFAGVATTEVLVLTEPCKSD